MADATAADLAAKMEPQGSVAAAAGPRRVVVRVKRRHDEDPWQAFELQGKRSKQVSHAVYHRIQTVRANQDTGPSQSELLRRIKEQDPELFKAHGSKSALKERAGASVKQHNTGSAAATRARKARFQKVEAVRVLGSLSTKQDSAPDTKRAAAKRQPSPPASSTTPGTDPTSDDDVQLVEIETAGVQADRASNIMSAMTLSANGIPLVSRTLDAAEQRYRAQAATTRRQAILSRLPGTTGPATSIRRPTDTEPPVQTQEAPSEYVYDYYVTTDDANIDFSVDELEMQQWFDSLPDDADEPKYSDDDDSNEEDNWRNDYPDEESDVDVDPYDSDEPSSGRRYLAGPTAVDLSTQAHASVLGWKADPQLFGELSRWTEGAFVPDLGEDLEDDIDDEDPDALDHSQDSDDMEWS
ncbi:uncharacterized protein MONBRDRAFT_28172 [Monosiga brevicollis MX1]|uniref:Probable RNA polymerase II nuclear localization protein SLC7A6OS n=1 Tax=Monosiga brevicollis TaxID=81824 RepID=A9V7E6_MONBE|nr:uncharacterized protein MONBRDRAFT_28172 [Monosiga brevicollis MX1]EDQ86501.1 predicted protein [Monosiga brevicollis MX1]|eukprot:XP_001748614.1 hypothetical protein [Monosiga brevicollis MX1]